MSDDKKKFAGRLKDRIWWFLSKKKPFYINDEYKIELEYVDKKTGNAKIIVTNLKTNQVVS